MGEKPLFGPAEQEELRGLRRKQIGNVFTEKERERFLELTAVRRSFKERRTIKSRGKRGISSTNARTDGEQRMDGRKKSEAFGINEANGLAVMYWLL